MNSWTVELFYTEESHFLEFAIFFPVYLRDLVDEVFFSLWYSIHVKKRTNRKCSAQKNVYKVSKSVIRTQIERESKTSTPEGLPQAFFLPAKEATTLTSTCVCLKTL